MAWIKRNLVLVISAAIALGLLGFGGYYLYSAIQKNNLVDTEIGSAKSEIERLLTKAPTPNSSNLVNAKRELERLTTFTAAAKSHFRPTPPPARPLNNESFKTLLQSTIDELHKQANSVGIQVETNYYFSFSAHRGSLEFAPELLRPLSERLQEVQLISTILFRSRVNRLEHIRRAMVPGERVPSGVQGAGAGDYIPAPPRTNPETQMALWPYEVTFHCFTMELGAVLEAIEQAPFGFVVKSIASDISPDAAPSAPAARAAPPGQPRRQPPPQRGAAGRPITPAAAAAAAPVPALKNVIDEKLLRITLRLEVIKPEPVRPQR